MFIHKTFHFLHIRLFLQAFPITICLCCSFPTSPIVARQFSLNFLTSPDGNLTNINACTSSFHAIVAEVQAAFINFHLDDGVTSRLNIFIPSGIYFSCFLFQAFISDFSQLITVSHNLIHFQAKTYLFSPST